MVDESGVETVKKMPIHTDSTFNWGSRLRSFDGLTYVEHPKFGMVSVRLETGMCMDTSQSVKEWESDFRAFIERCVASIEEAARTA